MVGQWFLLWKTTAGLVHHRMLLLSIRNVARLLHSSCSDFAFSLIMMRFCSPLHLLVTACPDGFIILHQPFAPGCCQLCLMGTVPLHYKTSQRETTVQNIIITSLQRLLLHLDANTNTLQKSTIYTTFRTNIWPLTVMDLELLLRIMWL